jgi:hypothetical protein
MTASFTDHTKLDEHVRDTLKLSGSKERFSGVVSKISGTTTWIKSGDSEFLAWSRSDLVIGANVEFAIDQLQAIRVEIQKIPAAT